MPPVKFDDIPKVATAVLSDDYQVSGCVLKTKQTTSWGGSVLSSQVDLFSDAKCATPSKLTWRLPTPFGCPMFVIDKLEMDKGGKYKLEASTDKVQDGLKLECKSDLSDINKTTVACTYTGVKDLQVKTEHKLTKPQDFTGEVTYACPVAVCGMKFTSAGLLSGGLPDFGMRFHKNLFFGSITAKDKLSVYTAHCMYQATPLVKVAATYQHGGKASGNCSLAISCKNLYKIKVSEDQSVCCSVKHSVAKGMTVIAGAKYGAKGDLSCGLQLSVE
mmetsp:Transcript_75473/g.219223  ORF Transcript_75473/g.219223 Transcript_75473/m.219223 type:complete len:274 (-) Transcript_75473:20-841(-)|eukprot:CAMPEP_0176092844 /NCGR_PEP_ID=MMETSP0120_2-20121206/46516_1 /TAXON_ID=160619 /ORGANISM="Kryptoperidinium foliaceum, Strain CCMP 1326" /LENGTH=273 /DNA_ID=CAMNT_0017426765 /DNA_START=61 /DNA_END=882 /DNA_ORIENTATION=+